MESQTSVQGPTVDASVTVSASTLEYSCDTDTRQLQHHALALINQARSSPRRCGNANYAQAAPLKLHPRLYVAAKAHATEMATANFFSHTGKNGSSVGDRAILANYQWRAIGENIAAGQKTAQHVISGWLDSPSHCSNIMNAAYTQMSFSCVTNERSELKRYWIQVLGTPRH